MKKIIKSLLAPLFRSYDLRLQQQGEAIRALYKLLYNQVHDVHNALPLAATQTVDTFGFQWGELKDGEAMLSDEWFKGNVEKIITEREILISKDWFKGKDVIDCGCGGGRWSYGLAQLGANIIAVDINNTALQATSTAIEQIPVQKSFIQSPLEDLSSRIGDKKFDLAWSWGVLHHCPSFMQAFDQVMNCVKEGGVIYLYLYGRESLSYEADIDLFINRVRYNTISTWEGKKQFLLEKSGGDETKLHQNHDIFAPLLNRRLEFSFVKELLEKNGFTDVTRTVQASELHIRAVKGKVAEKDKKMFLYPESNPAWYSKYYL